MAKPLNRDFSTLMRLIEQPQATTYANLTNQKIFIFFDKIFGRIKNYYYLCPVKRNTTITNSVFYTYYSIQKIMINKVLSIFSKSIKINGGFRKSNNRVGKNK
ncbi:MAG: hypothetical protein Q4Q06_05335 [Bacteroidota bacterium]|nr:hypothetical protein [Bacteroidota bacterium]